MRVPAFAFAACVLSSPALAGGLDLRIVDQAGKPVADAVVTVYPAGGVPRGALPAPAAPVMVQENIAFVPHVLVVPVGTTVRFPNHDKVRHHVYSFSKAAKFEIKLFGKDETRSYTFPNAGTVALGCNIHDQMSGFIKVVDTPFAAKTGADGQVAIPGISPGAAQVIVWHPDLRAKDNEQRSTLLIPASGAAPRTVSLPIVR